MRTTHTIPISSLVRAVAALKAAKNTPVGTTLDTNVWIEVMRAHTEMTFHLEKVLENQTADLSYG